MPGQQDEPRRQVAHHVFFTLKDSSPEEVTALITGCETYLREHEGVTAFGVGPRIADHQRDVNVRDFHVGLHVVFRDRAAHDAYQVSPRHHTFSERFRDNWAAVRVFDTHVS